MSGGAVVGTAAIYDPSTKAWTNSASTMAIARQYHTATLLSNGKVLIYGGQDTLGAALNSGYLYDPTLDTFTAVTAGNTRTKHIAILLADGATVLFAAGGT